MSKEINRVHDSVFIQVHPLLKGLANGREAVEVKGENVEKCLAGLNGQSRGMRENIFDKHGKPKAH